jgi:cation diffusion facilitator family transporter
VTEGNRRAIAAAFLANLGIALAKFAAFLVTGASSMLAEAVHSLADTGNQSLLFLGAARARREPDTAHPFGYGNERYFWSFVVALMLFSLGSVFAIFQGVDRLRHPHDLESPGWAIAVLLVGIALESWSLRTAVQEANRTRAGASWWSFVRRAKTPEIPVVLLEDLGALLGLAVALAGVSLTIVLGDARYDALASITIGALLGVIAVVLASEMKSLLIGEAASASNIEAIRNIIEAAPHVRRLIHLRTLHIGPDALLVGAKVELDAELHFAQVADVINALETRLREEVPATRMIYVEPDVHLAPPGTPSP